MDGSKHTEMQCSEILQGIGATLSNGSELASSRGSKIAVPQRSFLLHKDGRHLVSANHFIQLQQPPCLRKAMSFAHNRNSNAAFNKLLQMVKE